MARSNAVMKRTVVGEGTKAVINWTAIEGGRTVKLDLSKLTPKTIDALLHHGAFAKVGDAAAKSNATTSEKFDSMQSVIDNLLADKWHGDRTGGGDTSLLDAILKADPKLNRDKAAAHLKTLSDAEKKALRVHPPIKKILDSMAEEAAKAAGADAKTLLAKFA